MSRTPLITAALLATLILPTAAEAQGIIGDTQDGAATSRHAADPVGGVVVGVVGG